MKADSGPGKTWEGHGERPISSAIIAITSNVVRYRLRAVVASIMIGFVAGLLRKGYRRPAATHQKIREGGTMSSNWVRLGLLAGLAALMAGALALAQDRAAGEPASQGRADVFNPVEGRVVVLTSRPDGALVAKGDTVCELDPTELKNRLAIQELVVRGAEADVHGARIAREVAALAVTEYKEGIFVQEHATVNGEIKLSESDLARAEDRLDWTTRMYEKGYSSKAEAVSEELALKKARFALEVAQSKLKVLLDHTRAKTIKALTGSVETGRARELAKQAALERERSVQKKLMDQIKRCAVAAPTGGRIEYVSPIGAGAVVHDGQLLFRVVPEGATGKAK
jgi:multidrug resistance efflux pump